MTDDELYERAKRRRHWPATVDVKTRMEIVKARGSLDKFAAIGTSVENVFFWDSNGQAAMLRCFDEYAGLGERGVPVFDEQWARETLRKHESVLKELTDE